MTVEHSNGIDKSHTAGITERRPGMERLIEILAKDLGNGIGWAAESGVLFVAFAVLWAAFAAGVIWSEGSVDQTWEFLRSLPLIAQAVVWLLLLPVMAGLWIWETSWPVIVRLLVVGGIAGWNLLVFLPKALTAKP